MTVTIATPIALEARDLLPETWDALADATTFGPAALVRQHDKTVYKVFGELAASLDQAALNLLLIEYAGKRLAYSLLDPAIDFWSKQALSLTAGQQESKAWKDRAEDLKQLKKDWLADLSDMQVAVGPFLPTVLTGRASDAPKVAQAGQVPAGDPTADNPRSADTPQVAHTTAYPYDLPPAYGPPA